MARRRVEVLVCGSPDRGDDGAAIAAAARLRLGLRSRADVEIVGHLTPEGLLDAAGRGPVLVLDAATGIRPGEIVELAFAALRSRTGKLTPRSSHELPIPEVVGLVELLLGRPPEGAVIVLGAAGSTLGAPLSPAVEEALPAYVRRIEEAIERLSQPAEG